jgi:hypothetical protein
MGVRVAAAVAIALLGLVAPSGALAAFPGANGRIAVSGEWGCDGSTIKTVRPNGSGLRALGECNIHDQYGTWTADGSTLLFKTWMDEGRRQPVMTMEPDGSARRELPVPDGDWAHPSPSGDQLVYERLNPVAERTEIWKVNFDGSGLVRLRAGQQPRFSPNGNTIAFVRPTIGGRQRGGLWLMDLDGEIIRRITRGRIAHADWSPTGRRLAYAQSDEHSDIYTIGVRGQNRRRLTRTERKNEASPAWSPDGRWIAFVRITRPERRKPQEVRRDLARGGTRSKLVVTLPRLIEPGFGTLYPYTLSWQARP